jgi:hypothetical protein
LAWRLATPRRRYFAAVRVIDALVELQILGPLFIDTERDTRGNRFATRLREDIAECRESLGASFFEPRLIIGTGTRAGIGGC